jgi:UDP-N-acetyl-D-mannosaminuronate dehydrogenase
VIERSRHQALRLHEVHAGAGMGGHCIPVDRSTFPGR